LEWNGQKRTAVASKTWHNLELKSVQLSHCLNRMKT